MRLSKSPLVLLWAGVFVIYLVFSRGGYDGYELENFLTAENMFLSQRLFLAPGYSNLPGIPNANDERVYYVRHGLAQPLLEAPLYAVGYFASRFVTLTPPEIATSTSDIASLNMVRLLTVSLFNPLVASLTVIIFFDLLRRMWGDQKLALAVSLVYAFGTLTWPYAEIGLEPLLALSLLGSFYFLFRWKRERRSNWLVWAGVSLAVLINTKSYAPVLLLPLLVYIIRIGIFSVPKRFREIELSIFLGLLTYFGFNYFRFGSLLNLGEGGSFFTNWSLSFLPTGLAVVFLSFGKSIWAYSPVLIGGFWGLREFRHNFKEEFTLILLLGLTLIALFAPSWYVVADEMWGTRYFLPLTAFLLVLAVPAIVRWWQYRLGQVLLASLMMASVLVQLPGVLFWSTAPVEVAQAAGADTMEEIVFIPQYSPAVVGQRILMSGVSRLLTGRSLVFKTQVIPDTAAAGTAVQESIGVDLGDYDRMIILPVRALIKYQ